MSAASEIPLNAGVREPDVCAPCDSNSVKMTWPTSVQGVSSMPTASPENAPVGITKTGSEGNVDSSDVADAPHLIKVTEQLHSYNLRNTGFAHTLRYMFYRSFRRQYLGTHQRTWGAFTATCLILFVAALNLTIYAASCQKAFMTNTPTNSSGGQYASLVFSAVTVLLMIGLFFICRTPSAYRLSAYTSLIYMLVDIVCLIGLVVLTTKQAEEVPLRRLGPFHEHVRGYILSPQIQHEEDFMSAPPTLFGAGDHLLGQSCSRSNGRYFIFHWFLISYQILQCIIIGCDVIWMRVLSRLGEWYYLKSNFFVNGWLVKSVRPVRFLVPTQGRTSPKDITTALQQQRTLGRFRVRSGLCVELVGTITVNRLVNWTSKVLCLRQSTPADKLNRQRRSKWRIIYTGELNEAGKPEGFGYWLGDEMLGENMIGFWHDGEPSGPSKSREVTSGSGLACIKLGWARCLLSEKRLEFGVALVECSVSGRFFRGFPDVRTFNAPLIKKRDSGIFKQAKRGLERMVKEGRRVVLPSTYVADVPELQTHDQPTGWYPPRHRSMELGARSQSMAVSPTPVTVPEPCQRRAQSTQRAPPDGRLLPRSRTIRWFSRTDRTRPDYLLLKEAKAREVIRNYRESVKWILDELHPHTPAFSLQGRSEVTISVDKERGLSILGFAPVEQVLIQQYPRRDSSSFANYLASVTAGPILQARLSEVGKACSLFDPVGDRGASDESSGSDSLMHQSVRTPTLGEIAADRKLNLAVSSALPAYRTGTTTAAPQSSLDHHGFGPNVQEPSPSEVTSKDAISGEGSGPIMTTVSSVAEVKANDKVEVSIVDKSVLGGSANVPNDLIDVNVPELVVEGWIPMESIGLSEVLIYVHGFNNSQQECQQTLGQMAAFGNLPSHLKVLVFTWPAGAGAFSFFSAQSAAEDPVCHEAFTQLLVSLQHNDVRQVHIMAHSMGSRLFLKSLRGILQRGDILMTKNEAPVAGKIQLVTTTFMNPEYSVSEFVDCDYELLRSCCANITIYADGNDRALWWAEAFSGRTALGRSVCGLREQGSAGPRSIGAEGQRGANLMHATSFVQVDGPENEWTRFEPQSHTVRRRRIRRRGWRSFRSRKEQIVDSDGLPGDWLDVDIIDTTFMDRNVSETRHSFWNLNREIIEDLRELLVTRKRARQRMGRLDRRDGNVWVFRVAPSFLTSIFETP